MTDYAERAFSHGAYGQDFASMGLANPSPWSTPSAHVAPPPAPKKVRVCDAEKNRAYEKARRDKAREARQAANTPKVYAYPSLPNGRFIPKQPGQVWRPVNVVSQMQKLATRVNKETDWCAPTKFISTKARR